MICIVQDQHLFAVETGFPATDIIQLIVNSDRADDQYYRDAELKNDQAAAKPAGFKSGRYFAFQYVYGLERRQIKCGVAARHKADQYHQAKGCGQEPGREQGAYQQLFSCQLIESRKQQDGGSQSQQQGNKTKQNGFCQELCYKVYSQ